MTLDIRNDSPITPSLGATLARTVELAQQVATDEIRLLQLDTQGFLIDALRKGGWIGLGALCLAVAWIAGWAAAVIALADHFSLEARLAMLATAQLLLGASFVAYGFRRRAAAR